MGRLFDDHVAEGSPSAFRSAALAVCSASESVLIVAAQVLAVGPLSPGSARTSSASFSSAVTNVVIASPTVPVAPADSSRESRAAKALANGWSIRST